MLKIEKIKTKIDEALNDAEKIWRQVKPEFINESLRKAFSAEQLVPTKIPGYKFIEEGKPEVADFIALVLDVRESTKHLTQAISAKTAKASQLERVLYEMTAINTAGAIIVDSYNGSITEFLGDGYLALFKVNNKADPKEVYSAHNSAKYFLNIALPKINEIIKERYSLPPLKVGIGMAFSKAIVTVVGYDSNIHPKAIGECVYRASKLSDGINKILIDDRLEQLWPTSKEGKLRFVSCQREKLGFKAFEIGRKN